MTPEQQYDTMLDTVKSISNHGAKLDMLAETISEHKRTLEGINRTLQRIETSMEVKKVPWKMASAAASVVATVTSIGIEWLGRNHGQ